MASSLDELEKLVEEEAASIIETPRWGVAILDGKVFTMRGEKEASLNTLIEEYKCQLAKIVRDKLSYAESLIQEIKEANKGIIPLPRVRLTHILDGIRVLSDEGGRPNWLIPFRYAPKYVEEHGKKVYEICAQHKARMETRCVLHIRYYNSERVYLGLLTLDLKQTIYHYHTANRADCTGKYRPLTPITVEEALKVAREYEKVLETIYVPSIAAKNPRNTKETGISLPMLSTLRKQMKLVTNKGWKVSVEPTEVQLFERGNLVRVAESGEGAVLPFMVNTVGVVDEAESVDSLLVEFAYKENLLHDGLTEGRNIGHPHQCWWLPGRNLILQPNNTPLTRACDLAEDARYNFTDGETPTYYQQLERVRVVSGNLPQSFVGAVAEVAIQTGDNSTLRFAFNHPLLHGGGEHGWTRRHWWVSNTQIETVPSDTPLTTSLPEQQE